MSYEGSKRKIEADGLTEETDHHAEKERSNLQFLLGSWHMP